MTQSNLDRYRADLEKLVLAGQSLLWAMQLAVHPAEFKKAFKEQMKDTYDEMMKKIPYFDHGYQNWYSEALSVVKQLIPDRLDDFIRHYAIPKGRKDITWTNYMIEDYLQGLRVTRGGGSELIVDRGAAIPRFEQQVVILKSAERRFESSLFDMRQLVQADLMDSEIGSARLLKKNGFLRARWSSCWCSNRKASRPGLSKPQQREDREAASHYR